MSVGRGRQLVHKMQQLKFRTICRKGILLVWLSPVTSSFTCLCGRAGGESTLASIPKGEYFNVRRWQDVKDRGILN